MPEVVVALDLQSRRAALDLVDRIDGLRWVKVGSVLFVREGPQLVAELKKRGLLVFLDLKWHDIPSTVAGAARQASELGVDMSSLHALGGGEMIAAAAAVRGPMSLVAVTVLTSHGEMGLGAVLGKETSIGAEVVRLAGQSVAAGADGIVCSARELELVAGLVPASGPVVVPGIRFAGGDNDDQSRVATPQAAAARGATHLVVGRPVWRSADPVAAFTAFAEAAS